MPRSTRSGRPIMNVPPPPLNPDQQPPVLEPVGEGDARILIETSQQRNAQVLGMDNLTPDQITEAIRMYRNQIHNPHNQAIPETDHPENQQGSGESQHTRASIFERIGNQPKRTAHKAQSEMRNAEAERLRKLAEITEQIRQEEEAKLEANIQKRVREQEDILLRGSGPTPSKRHRIVISPEPVFPTIPEEEPETNLYRMVQEL